MKKFKVINYEKYVDCPKYVRWSELSESRASTNHGQSLEKLNGRGGLSPKEIMANVLDIHYLDLRLSLGESLIEVRKLECD